MTHTPTDTTGHEPPPEPPPSEPHHDGPTRPAWPPRRSRDHRVVAGVCAGLARATNTDPLLWRVVLAVFAVFGGVGIVVYLLAWILLPADGDTASPVEALVGKGTSSTGAAVTVVLGAIAFVAVFAVFESGLVNAALLAVTAVAVTLLIGRDRARHDEAGHGTPPAPPTGAGSPAGPPSTATPAEPEHATASLTPGTGTAAPFAPHGPYATAAVPPPTEPDRPRGIVGRLTFAAICLATAGLVIADTLGASIGAPVYFAVALALTALGLVVGAFFGRPRGLIALGVLLAIGLSVTGAVHRLGLTDVENRHWRPTTTGQLAREYRISVGESTLDLSELDLDGRTHHVELHTGLGSLRVILPPDTDIGLDIEAHVGIGDLTLPDGETAEGIGVRREHTRTETDDAGNLRLRLDVSVGELEVRR